MTTGKDLRDAGIARALASAKAAYREHYKARMATWYATVTPGSTFMLEEGHRMLTMPPAVPQQTSALSNAFIRPLLDSKEVTLYGQDCSGIPANHATRTRVYYRCRK